jgi:hypothetical protein
MLGAIIWYAVSARKWYKGPKVNIDHYMLGRPEAALEAREDSADSGGSSSNSISKETRAFDDKRAADLA